MGTDLHRDAIVADTHNDLLMLVARRPTAPSGGCPSSTPGALISRWSRSSSTTFYRPEGALHETLRMIEAAHRLAEENDDAVTICGSGAEAWIFGSGGQHVAPTNGLSSSPPRRSRCDSLVASPT
jgi:membrane dipeptidase